MNNIEKIRAAMLQAELDALYLTSGPNRFYATGFMSSAGAVVVTKDDAVFFTDFRYIEAAQKAVTGARVELLPIGRKTKEKVEEIVREFGLLRVGVEENRLSLALGQRLEKALAPAELHPAEKIMDALRAVKSPEEIELLRTAQAISERAFEEVLPLVRPGVTERELAAELTYRMLRHGADGNSFSPIVVSGARSSLPHGTPGENKIRKGSFVTMDFGCVKDGYCSDMTRTVAVGSATKEMKAVYEAVLAAQLAGIAAARPGVTGSAIDKAARDYLANEGLDHYFGHGFGHSLGIEIHEWPNARPGSEELLPAGTVMSAEPGVYIPGRFGVRIEDVMVFTAAGVEILTKTPKSLVIL